MEQTSGLILNDQITLDWLNFTWSDPLVADLRQLDPDERFRLYGSYSHLDGFLNVFPEFKSLDSISVSSYTHYEKSIKFAYDVFISYDGFDSKQEKGVNVVIPSHGLPFICELFNVSSAFDLLRLIYDRGGSFSRIDLCYDDYDRTFTPSYYFTKLRSGHLKSRMSQNSFISDGKFGETFSMGTRAGLRYFRIYDKLYESTKRNAKDSDYPVMDCIRYEFEYHSYGANSIVKHLFDFHNLSFFDICSSFFTIQADPDLTPDNRHKRSDFLLDPDWEIFVKNLKFNEETVQLPVLLPPKTLERKRLWFETYCMKTLAVFYETAPDILNHICELIPEFRKRNGFNEQNKLILSENKIFNSIKE